MLLIDLYDFFHCATHLIIVAREYITCLVFFSSEIVAVNIMVVKKIAILEKPWKNSNLTIKARKIWNLRFKKNQNFEQKSLINIEKPGNLSLF